MSDAEVTNDPAADFLSREQENLAGLEDPKNEVEANDESADNEEVVVGDSAGEEGDNAFVDLMGSHNKSVVSERPSTPDKIKQWREEQRARLEAKDKEEEEKKKELREGANKEMEDWYRLWNENLDARKKNNREHEKSISENLNSANSDKSNEWEKVADMCDFNQKNSKDVHGKDVGRLKSLLLHLKQKPPRRDQLANGK